jgi:hypothetical protein
MVSWYGLAKKSQGLPIMEVFIMASVLTGQMYNDRTYDFLCENCKRVVGRGTMREAAEIARTHAPVLCFECEGIDVESLALPIGNREEDVAWIIYSPEHKVWLKYIVVWDGAIPHFKLSETSALCLSSSPYLPKVKQGTVGLV